MRKICANCKNSDLIGTGMNDPLACKISGSIVGDFSLDCGGDNFIPIEHAEPKEDESNE